MDGIWINPVQGVKLTEEQFAKLLNKEPVFVKGMQKQQPKPKEGTVQQVETTDKKGQKYNAWVWSDAEAGRARHTSKHPDGWKAHTAKDATAFGTLSESKYDKRQSANEAATAIREAGTLRVTGVERKEVRQEPPLLYDLTSLQKDTNKQHGFSADKTLSIAQELYEKRVLSYPRTGSRYISQDVFEEIPHLVAMLRSYPLFGRYVDKRFDTTLNNRPVDDTKVTDHRALIITEDPATGISEEQQIIYNVVAGRMLEAFGERCIKENTTVSLEAGGVHFVARGNVTSWLA